MMAPTFKYILPPLLCARLEARAFEDRSVRPLAKISDPTGIACWLVFAKDGDRLATLGDLGLGEPEPMVVGHAFLSAIKGPTGTRLVLDPGFDRRLRIDTWEKVARRTGSIVAAEIELWRAGEALALSRCVAATGRDNSP